MFDRAIAPDVKEGDYRRDPLWLRIQAFAIDDPQSSHPLSQRLARENGWSRSYTARVIAEYRKFCYLALVAGPASPSDAVDQAWHMHLIYTRNYWDGFCWEVLGRPLHHSPSKGGTHERDKFKDVYGVTLATYACVFGASPPDDIWPDVSQRYAGPHNFRRIDVASHWVLPKFWRHS